MTQSEIIENLREQLQTEKWKVEQFRALWSDECKRTARLLAEQEHTK